MLPVSLDCPFLIGHSVFSNIALHYVQYLYITLKATICITLLKLIWEEIYISMAIYIQN